MVPGQLPNKEVFMKNISNVNSSIILKEKYFIESNPQIDYLNELFNDNFLKDNDRLIQNYHENKRNILKSSQLKKMTNVNNNSTNVNASTKFISGIIDQTNSLRKSVNSVHSYDRKENKKNFSSMNTIKSNLIFFYIFSFLSL